GDFVGKQTPKREAASGSLFDVELPKVPTMPPHRIEDFALFVAPDLLPHIRPVLLSVEADGIGEFSVKIKRIIPIVEIKCTMD
ncbi:hypothetical protein CNY89_28890, partial [Amaricoccus sp. HAR-UPW-R2A-40]